MSSRVSHLIEGKVLIIFKKDYRVSIISYRFNYLMDPLFPGNNGQKADATFFFFALIGPRELIAYIIMQSNMVEGGGLKWKTTKLKRLRKTYNRSAQPTQASRCGVQGHYSLSWRSRGFSNSIHFRCKILLKFQLFNTFYSIWGRGSLDFPF